MKQRKQPNQMQSKLFDEQRLNDLPSLLEMPADRGLELEVAVAELLLRAVGRVERGRGGDCDA